MKTLDDVMPREWRDFEHPALKFADVEVVKEHCSVRLIGDGKDDEPYQYWPGPHKNVHHWVELANGYAVGHNENPAKGWSFPCLKMKSKSTT